MTSLPRDIRRDLSAAALLCAMGLLSPGMCGCEVGRTWGSMSSDSPTPFFGVDLLPRRKTTDVTPPQPDADRRREFAQVGRTPALPAAWTAPTPPASFHELKLPAPSVDEMTEDVSLTGPSSAFAR